MTAILSVPQGFPDVAGLTNNRRVLAAIVDGLAPPPPSVPPPSSWSYGTVSGAAHPHSADAWSPGYLACVTDQYAGLVMLSVLPDREPFRTAGLTLDLHAPLRPGEVTIVAEVIGLTGQAATVEVTVTQRDRIISLATVRQVLRDHRGR